MATTPKAGIQASITAGIRTGSSDTTAAELRAILNEILDSYPNVIDDKNANNGYLGIDGTGKVDVSFIKKDTPTGDFLRDNGTWQPVVTNQTLDEVVTNGDFVLASDNTTELVKIDKVNDEVRIETPNGIGVVVNPTKAQMGCNTGGFSTFENINTSISDDTEINITAPIVNVTGDIIANNEINMPNEQLGAVLHIDSSGNIKSTLIQSNNVELKSNKATTMTGNTGSNILFLSAKAVFDWATGLFEPTSNKQNSLATDGTNTKYPTVTAVNAGLDLKQNIAQTIQTITSSATPTLSTTDDILRITAQAQNATFSAPVGTPIDGKSYMIEVNDNGTARTLAYNSIFNFGATAPAITTTTIGKKIVMCFIYLSTNNKYNHVGSLNDL